MVMVKAQNMLQLGDATLGKCGGNVLLYLKGMLHAMPWHARYATVQGLTNDLASNRLGWLVLALLCIKLQTTIFVILFHKSILSHA
jgi:hypothetical protein